MRIPPFILVFTLVLTACVHTAPLPPLPEAAARRTVRVDTVTVRGDECLWEAEQLTYGGEPVWTAEPPSGENWCSGGTEVGRMVDLGQQNGPFLSTTLTTLDVTPNSTRWTTRCVTWNLGSRTPTKLEGYDEKHADRRWAQALVIQAGDPTLAGWAMERDSFLIDGRHLTFCAIRQREVRQIHVR